MFVIEPYGPSRGERVKDVENARCSQYEFRISNERAENKSYCGRYEIYLSAAALKYKHNYNLSKNLSDNRGVSFTALIRKMYEPNKNKGHY